MRLGKEAHADNIEFIHGDSTTELEKAIEPDVPTVFFLDAHWHKTQHGDKVGRGAKDCPLVEELQTIMNKQYTACLIIIDDAKYFGKLTPEQDMDWRDLTTTLIEQTVKPRMLDRVLINDRFVIWLKEQFIV